MRLSGMYLGVIDQIRLIEVKLAVLIAVNEAEVIGMNL